MLTINWNDIKLNGMPAINRTLEYLVKESNALEIRHNLEIHQLEERMRRLEDAHDQLRAEQVSQQEVVEELGHGWRIERQPATPNASVATSVPPANQTTTVEDIDRQMAGVMSLVDRILHSQDR
jgi:cytoskeletal protein RodZ